MHLKERGAAIHFSTPIISQAHPQTLILDVRPQTHDWRSRMGSSRHSGRFFTYIFFLFPRRCHSIHFRAFSRKENWQHDANSDSGVFKANGATVQTHPCTATLVVALLSHNSLRALQKMCFTSHLADMCKGSINKHE